MRCKRNDKLRKGRVPDAMEEARDGGPRSEEVRAEILKAINDLIQHAGTRDLEIVLHFIERLI